MIADPYQVVKRPLLTEKGTILRDDENVFATKHVQKNDLGLIFGVHGSKWRCTSFSFRLALWVCEDLVTV